MRPTETAILFDVQHMCLQDGPGVRTGLFFKGCPLRCQWCHNPESYEMGVQLLFNASRCVGCGECAAACPNGAQISNGKGRRIDRERCAACGLCVERCCYNALSLVGRRYTVDELWAEVEGDRPYFGKADAEGDSGGVTLTGGEPMLQFPFVKAFLERRGDTHVCMETSGFAPTEHYLAILPMVDLFLMDYKATNPETHRRLCGQDNFLIRKNLDMLCEAGARLVLRLPLIPGVNDDREHMEGIAALLSRYPAILRGEIMAYHRMGVGKNGQLGMEPALVDQPNASDGQKREWLDALHGLGAKRVVIG